LYIYIYIGFALVDVDGVMEGSHYFQISETSQREVGRLLGES